MLYNVKVKTYVAKTITLIYFAAVTTVIYSLLVGIAMSSTTDQMYIQSETDEKIKKYQQLFQATGQAGQAYIKALNAAYMQDIYFKSGLFFYKFMHDSELVYSFPTTSYLSRAADIYMLSFLEMEADMAAHDSQKCLSVQKLTRFFDESDLNEDKPTAVLAWSLNSIINDYKVARAIYDFEKKATGLGWPTAMVEELDQKPLCLKKVVEYYRNHPDEKCFDYQKYLVCLGGKTETLISRLKSPHPFSEAPCPTIVEYGYDTPSNEAETRRQPSAKAQTLGADYINRYRHLVADDDQSMAAEVFNRARLATTIGGWHFEREDYDKAAEQYSVALSLAPSFAVLARHAEANLWKLVTAIRQHQPLDIMALDMQKNLDEIILHYESAIEFYGFERCEDLTNIPEIEVDRLWSTVDCLKKMLNDWPEGHRIEAELRTCLTVVQPFYRRCVEQLMTPWPCSSEKKIYNSNEN